MLLLLIDMDLQICFSSALLVQHVMAEAVLGTCLLYEHKLSVLFVPHCLFYTKCLQRISKNKIKKQNNKFTGMRI